MEATSIVGAISLSLHLISAGLSMVYINHVWNKQTKIARIAIIIASANIANQMLMQTPFQIIYLLQGKLTREMFLLIAWWYKTLSSLVTMSIICLNTMASVYILELFSVVNPKITRQTICSLRAAFMILYLTGLCLIMLVSFGILTEWKWIRIVVVDATIALSLIFEHIHVSFTSHAICAIRKRSGISVSATQLRITIVIIIQIILDWYL
jgi:hypothetical protein